jgi:para-aminobenzoate synthetase / 4-amino-4-deoxychorismate lyase
MRKIVMRDSRAGRWLTWERPVAVLSTGDPREVPQILAEIRRQVDAHGLHAAGYVSFEAAAGFDAALTTHAPGAMPVAGFGLFREPAAASALPAAVPQPVSGGQWLPATPRDRYVGAIASIKEQIALGNTYQINYTLRLTADDVDEPWQLFLRLATSAPYSAYLESDAFAIVSASPELFFSLDDGALLCRPMKGTAARGMTAAADRAIAGALAASAKNRAENVMITDMIRNDMGRVARTGTVRAGPLFALEKYPTVWQMTSTVSATTRAAFPEVFAALFPCASVTGAPKASSMAIISNLEESPREVYTGAIGHVSPGGKATFSVGIRTAWFDRRSGRGVYGVGGGIVWDSDADEEHLECVTKARVLSSVAEDRDFELLETLLWEDGAYLLLDYHLDRLGDSADYFDFAFDRGAVAGTLARLGARLGNERHRVRLLVARDGSCGSTQSPLQLPADAAPRRLALARAPVDRDDPFLYHKTTRRAVYERALAEAGDCDDVLLWNPDGCITESSTANVVVTFGGERFTPPVSSGLLAGTWRRRLLVSGDVREREIRVDELAAADAITLINSVRGEMPARLVDADGKARAQTH